VGGAAVFAEAAGVAGAGDAGGLELTILMPCLNEAATVVSCVGKALKFLADNAVAGEVLVADNGSTDGSAELAAGAGARVVVVAVKGNGAALMGGIGAARGRYVIMGDSDDSYDFLALAPFLAELREGADLVMGNRFRGGIAPDAMPGLHRYLGNPFFSALGRLFYSNQVGDFHCGLRGFRRDKIAELGMVSLGFEFCSEMVIKATFRGWVLAEVPTTLARDGRDRAPHLNTWRDGLRHLRFFALYSPRWLFFYPGLLLAGAGAVLAAMVTVSPNGVDVGRFNLDIDALVVAAGMVIVGYQAVIFAALAKVYAAAEGFMLEGRWTRRVRGVRLEVGLGVSAVFALAGVIGMVVSILHWRGSGFGAVDPEQELRLVVPSVLAFVLSAQSGSGWLFVAFLGIRHGGVTVAAWEYPVADDGAVSAPVGDAVSRSQ
jgi:glycosyltransferase involved in cell wall biosynthesis